MKRVKFGFAFLVAFFFLVFFPDTAQASQWREEVFLDEGGYFHIQVHYEYLESRSSGANGTLYIDGEVPFDQARYFTFPMRVVYAEFPFLQDSLGNDRMPYRVQVMNVDSALIMDREGRTRGPLVFYLEQGVREISIEIDGFVRVLGIELVPYLGLPTYQEYRAAFPDIPVRDFFLTIEAEAVTYKSGFNIVPSSVNGAGVTPSEPGVRRLNVIGLTSFDGAGDFAQWNFEVEEDGFYYLTFRYQQNTNVNLNSYRRIYINGEVPFREFETVAFPFTTRWRNLTLEQAVFLSAGENSIRIAVTLAPYAQVREALHETVNNIRGLDMNLRAIIGNEVDPFRIWNLENYIPDIADRLTTYANDLEAIMEELSRLTGFSSNEYRALQAGVRDIRRFANRPDSLARTAHSLSQVVGSITDWLIALDRQPVVLDKFYVHSSSASVPAANPNVFVRFWGAVRNFFASFAQAASISTPVADGEGIQVWVRRPRDYVDLMQRMADDIFTPQSGIPVNVSFIPDNTVLVLANAAGQLPELAGGIDINTPFEYAIRGALRDLTTFDGFDELVAPMTQGALVPYRYMGGVFALPEEVIFNVMFYRTDILESLGLEAPSTWDDVLDLVPVLTRNSSTFFFPYGDFQTFFAQRGIQVYTEDGLSLACDSEEGFAAFRFWTDLYIKHGLPARMDSFYQHFRMGTAAVGVTGINEYMRFTLTAPDIAGQWRVAPIPGTIGDDGFINRSQAGIQNGMMMFNTSSEREDMAWDFMQWWLSTPTQIRFAQNLEQFYGPEFRWFTANFDVLAELDWRPDTMVVFEEQLRWYNPVPLVPGGSYMTGREIWNAWTRVVIRQQHYREELEIAFRDIRNEMARKQLEFGIIDQDGNVLRTLEIQTHDPSYYFRGRGIDD
ncbi:MAG: extracellular solute-binding protein [Defluviitaleaceae bacterium]|nr:extracellular solute-binding protein [Defluviitaleaceae bacterium]